MSRFPLSHCGRFPSPLAGEGGTDAGSAFVTGEGYISAHSVSAEGTPHPALRATFSHKGRREEAPRLIPSTAHHHVPRSQAPAPRQASDH